VRSLPNIEVVFDDFYRRYEVYRTDLAIWQAQYGNLVNPPQQAVQVTSAPVPDGTAAGH
jgi:hypothetical protein